MNNIAQQSQLAGLSPRQNSLPDFQSLQYAKEQSFRSSESLNTDLVIQTKDGDQVTLKSNSFSHIDAFMYDKKGVVQTEAGTAFSSQQHREITLASGQSFSFSVAGDLSEDELDDIEAILTGLDEVISEMTQGDMQGALNEALEMGDYDSVSSFAADISYRRSVEMTSYAAASATQVFPVNTADAEANKLSTPTSDNVPGMEKFQGGNGAIMDFDRFFNKLLKQLEAHEEKQVGFAQNPIDKLFDHHLDDLGEKKDTGSIYSTLERAKETLDSLIEDIFDKVFDEQVSEAENELE